MSHPLYGARADGLRFDPEQVLFENLVAPGFELLGAVLDGAHGPSLGLGGHVLHEILLELLRNGRVEVQEVHDVFRCAHRVEAEILMLDEHDFVGVKFGQVLVGSLVLVQVGAAGKRVPVPTELADTVKGSARVSGQENDLEVDFRVDHQSL